MRKPSAKKELVMEICRFIGWDFEQTGWRIWNSIPSVDFLKDLVKRIKEVEGKSTIRFCFKCSQRHSDESLFYCRDCDLYFCTAQITDGQLLDGTAALIHFKDQNGPVGYGRYPHLLRLEKREMIMQPKIEPL